MLGGDGELLVKAQMGKLRHDTNPPPGALIFQFWAVKWVTYLWFLIDTRGRQALVA